jgi:UDP:flavonoid glycosyltransferase YjiC (YdhE family)
LLSGIDAVVTHGGSGTVLGTLAAGLPMVLVPQGADQPQNAQRVAAGGAGIAFPLGEAAPHAVAQALARVLTEPRYRAAAQGIGEEIAATPSAPDVARMLIEAVKASRAQLSGGPGSRLLAQGGGA